MSNQANQQYPTIINYAMNTGVVVGAYYIGKFCLFPLSFSSAFSGLLFIGLTLLVPYLIYRLVRTYRDRCLDGHIEFVQALVYAMLIMTFGSILAAAAHYIYFAFIDGGRMVGALEQSIEQFSAIDLSTLGTAGNDSSIAQLNQYFEMMKTTATQIKALTPIDITMGMLSNNISWAIIIAFPIALLTARHNRNAANTLNQPNNQ